MSSNLIEEEENINLHFFRPASGFCLSVEVVGKSHLNFFDSFSKALTAFTLV